MKQIVYALGVVALALGALSTTPLHADELAEDVTLVKAQAKDTGATAGKLGDSIVLTFSHSTNKFDITNENLEDEFSVSAGKSMLDANGEIQSASWGDDGKVLTIVLSAGGGEPTIAIGNTISVAGNSIRIIIDDVEGNAATGSVILQGSFQKSDAEESKDEPVVKYNCGNQLINGRLYKIGDSPTVYLAAACRLMPFRGAAVFHARGMKFENIIILSSQPADVSISDKPVLPAEGTLIKGGDATVWFVGKNGKRRGFTSEAVFRGLGFRFEAVQQISDSDLGTMSVDANISDDSKHPDGAVVKCGNSSEVFKVIGNMRFPFANFEAFRGRGHSAEHILTVDCGRFAYKSGAAIE
ncbi:MAG TPA: hypothetical protein PKD79_01460 [Candidatus Doudnabacteria bacterium]|nr:hypothetical protein [Candidatus Doudnabacteria bacterium]